MNFLWYCHSKDNQTVINVEESSDEWFTGIPQGFVVSLLLFLLYNNEYNTGYRVIIFLVFADITSVMITELDEN
jgi:hypothetical protein